MKNTLLSIALVTVIFSLQAQTPVELIRDINTTKIPSLVNGTRILNGKLLYRTSSIDDAPYLWSTDGVNHQRLGACSPYFLETSPEADGILYFTEGLHIWKTDGSVGGTEIAVPDVNLYHLVGSIYANNKIFYTGQGDEGAEPWVADLTTRTTTLLKNIAADYHESNPNFLFEINATVYFTAMNESYAARIWKTDGTPSGTTLANNIELQRSTQLPIRLGDNILFVDKDFNLRVTNGSNTSTVLKNTNGDAWQYFIPKLFVAHDQLYFTVLNDGFELWKTDGTIGGTSLIKDIGPLDLYIGDWLEVNNLLYFTYSDWMGRELWRTDGTANGTFMVKDIYPQLSSSGPEAMTSLGDKVFFVHYDGTSYKLFSTDGTESGTTPLVTIVAGGLSTFLKAFDDAIYFTMSSEDEVTSLWKTDGTVANTKAVTELGPLPYYGGGLIPIDDKLFIIQGSNDVGSKIWTSDGTASETKPILIPGNEGSSNINSFLIHENNLFFNANDGIHHEQVWKTDGLTTTTAITDFDHTVHFPLTTLNDRIVFTGNNENGTSLWSVNSNGTSSTKLASFGDNYYRYKSMLTINSTVFFAGSNPGHGVELWKSDGTVNGTSLLKDLTIGEESSWPGTFINHDDQLFFFSKGVELWKSDGSSGGTTLIKTIEQDTAGVQFAGQSNDLFFFTSINRAQKLTLWRSNGTPDGSFAIDVVSEGKYYYTQCAMLNGTLYYTKLGDHTDELWKTNGQPGDNVFVAEFENEYSANVILDLVAANDLIFFTATTTAQGHEVWKTDGITTEIVQDIANGELSSNPNYLTDVSDSVVFSTIQGDETKFWSTNGTETHALATVSGLVVESSFVPFKNRLFFIGRTTDKGAELYALGTTTVASIEGKTANVLNAYPNPVFNDETITIQMPTTSGYLELMSVNGTRIGNFHFTNSKITLPGSSLPSGVIILKAQTSKGIFTNKILKR